MLMLAVEALNISGYSIFEIQLILYSFKVLLFNNENSQFQAIGRFYRRYQIFHYYIISCVLITEATINI